MRKSPFKKFRHRKNFGAHVKRNHHTTKHEQTPGMQFIVSKCKSDVLFCFFEAHHTIRRISPKDLTSQSNREFVIFLLIMFSAFILLKIGRLWFAGTSLPVS